MKKRVLSLLLAALAVLSLCAPALADPAPEPTETPIPSAEPETTDEPAETPEPTEAPAETTAPTPEDTAEPEPTPETAGEPEETPVPSPEAGAEQTPDPDGELMPIAEDGEVDVEFTLSASELTMKSALRPIRLDVYMKNYVSDERNHWKCTSSDESVVTVEQIEGKAMSVAAKAQIKLWAKGPGTAIITISPDEKFSPDRTCKNATCTVTVVQDETTTWGMTLDDIDAMGVDAASKMQIYDPRDLGYMTDVNLQIGGICGMEGNIAAMEASIVKQGFLSKSEADMAERHLVYHHLNRSYDPVGYSNEDVMVNLNWEHTPISIHAVGAFLTQWNGPIHDNGNDPTQYNVDGYPGCIAVPEDVLYVYPTDEELKKLIVQYGGVAFGYYSSGEGTLYHKHSTTGAGWHCSAIVGWDDTVEKELFVNADPMSRPLNGGAWIVKNSWGPDKHSDGHGYFYLSYEAGRADMVAYKMMPRGRYGFNYFYDGMVENEEYYDSIGLDCGEAAVSFQAKMAGDGESEYLEAVNVGVALAGDVTVEVYTNVPEDKVKGDAPDPTWGYYQPSGTGHRTVPGAGFFTIPLGCSIKLEQDQYFTVVVKAPGNKIIYVEETSKNDLTFVKKESGWENTHKTDPANRWDRPKTLRIKALTSAYPAALAPAPPDATPAPSPTVRPAATATPAPTATATPTPTATATPTPTATATPTPTATATPTPTATATPTPTATATPTPTATATPTPTATATPTPTATATPTPTATATPTPTTTATPTATATATPTPAATATATPTPTATAAATATATPDTTATATATPSPTSGQPATSEPFYTPGPTPVSPTNAPDVPATGDGTSLALYAGLLALCAAGLALALRARRRAR